MRSEQGGSSARVRFDRYGYGPVFALYDPLASLYSRGQIAATKRVQDEFLSAGDRVLYPGVGRGEEALRAAYAGIDVTGLDISARMLGMVREQFEAAGLEATFRCEDAAGHWPEAPYDAIAAHYFLNLFEADRARILLEQFARWLRPGGRLLIADFARPAGGSFGQILSELYYRPVNAIAWGLGLCAWHPILDYADLLCGLPFRVISQRRFPVLAGDDPAYVTIVAERVADECNGGETSEISMLDRMEV